MRLRYDTQGFIEKSITIHGDRYDYSESNYLGNDVELKIICKIHGEFWQKPRVHWSNAGCTLCFRFKERKTTIDNFIKKASAIFDNVFDYSKCFESYDGKNVIIICKIHGEFIQQIYSHLKGFQGCHKCANKAYDIETFIFKANKVHNNKYDYSKTKYINAHTKLIINCKIHGEFEQLPCDHLNNEAGCSKCKNIWVSDTETFIDRANIIHNNKYDYSLTDYVSNKTKIKIICKKHGVFEQTPNRHLRTNCPSCNRRFANQEEFIEEAKRIHNNKYDYGSVEFINCRSKIDIMCNKHGIFKQTPSNHLQPNNCPKCINTISKMETEWLDSLNIKKEHRQYLIKIGKSKYRADGFDPETNTVYEYYGDYWHGNPKTHNPEHKNYENNKTFGELYERTMERENKIKQLGYKIVVMWENDYLASRQHLTDAS